MSLEYMSSAFGVSVKFIDRELANFITAGRIHAKIDKGQSQVKRPFSHFPSLARSAIV